MTGKDIRKKLSMKGIMGRKPPLQEGIKVFINLA